ncbi:helicase-like transcription factor isoform X2 [Saccostrea cucullata]|uniref:helicase-like transcription factor isoform X2 n=1 Tax=Saccostrea cuccullata TaxID=36930 RepID=UPI002ECFF462
MNYQIRSFLKRNKSEFKLLHANPAISDCRLPPHTRKEKTMEAINTFSPSFNNLWNTEESLNQEEIPDSVLYGTIRGLIESTHTFPGKVEANEAVNFKRGQRINSLLIVNRYGQEVGYLQSELEDILTRRMDRRIIQFKGVTPFASDGSSRYLAIDVTIWGVQNEKNQTLLELSGLKTPLNINVNPTESEEDIKKYISYKSDQRYITFNGNRFENLKEEGLELDRLFEDLIEGNKEGIAEPPKTISTPLHIHQKQALFWMKERESGELLPPFWEYRDGAYFNHVTLRQEVSRPPSVRGGILADDMGLGKTLTMIALIMADREESQEEVGNDEEKMDTEDGESSNNSQEDSDVILIEEGSHPPVILIDSDESDDELSEMILIDFDDSDDDSTEVIILDSDEDDGSEKDVDDEIIEVDDQNYFHQTDDPENEDYTGHDTRHYPTLIIAPLSILSVWQAQLREHVHNQYHPKIFLFHHDNGNRYNSALSEQDIVLTTYGTTLSDFNGVQALQGVNWFRIVLDEGHKIKNPNAGCSQAICNLRSERKWIISGTPIQNKIDDLFSMITFLNIDTFNDYENWSRIIETPLKSGDVSAKRRLYKLMSSIALRRTKGTKIDGKRLVDLPEKTVQIKYIEFSKWEKDIYDRKYQYYRECIYRFIERRKAPEEYRKVCCALLRLRQLCCHPSLFNYHFEVDEHQNTKRLMSFLRFPLNECSICLQTPDSPIITNCKHVFCKVCILQHMSQSGPSLCPNCRKPIHRKSFYEIPPDEINLRLTKPELDTWVASAKTMALLYDLIRLRENDPKEKALVVSEYTKLLDLLEPPLRNLNFNFVRFDGTMTQRARTKVINEFSSREENSPTVMLLSLRAGGEGISLVAAARIFLLTPHWNPATEDQCFDRCHRLGQTNDVIITKYVVKNTIEERILNLQEQKKKLMDCAFNYNKKKTEKPGINEIRALLDV